MEETNESRINIEDLPQAKQELTPEEAKDVKGGMGQQFSAVQKVKEPAGRIVGVIVDPSDPDVIY